MFFNMDIEKNQQKKKHQEELHGKEFDHLSQHNAKHMFNFAVKKNPKTKNITNEIKIM